MKGPLHLEEINRARDYYNALRGLDIPRAVRILDDAERGKYDELQKLNRMMEKRHPTMKGLKSRRLSALKKLTWDVKVPDTLPPGFTAAQAEAQRVYLRSSYEQIGNLPQVFEFLALPSFRGFSHLEKRYQDDDPSGPCTELKPVPQWHWLRDPQTWKWKYDPNARHDLARAVEIDPAGFIIREVDDPLCEIGLLCFIRRGLAKKDWTSFMEDYAIPSIFAMLGENTPLDKVKEWLAIMQQVTGNSRGALPPGSKAEILESGNLDGLQFENFIKAEDSDLVLAGTGGLLSMLTANTGLGGDKQGDNHEGAFDAIAQAEAMEITAILQRQYDKPLLNREFPSQPAVAYFELAALDKEDVDALAERTAKFSVAGFDADADELTEKSGMKLKKKEPALSLPNGAPVQLPAPGDPAQATVAAEAALKNRAGEIGREALFKSSAAANELAARRQVFAPLAQRLAALAALTDPTQRRTAAAALVVDSPALFKAVVAQAPDLAKPAEEAIGTALIDGFAAAAEAKKQAGPTAAITGPGAQTAISTRKTPPEAR